MLGRKDYRESFVTVYNVSKPYRYARKFFILCLLFAAFYVSKPYRYARKEKYDIACDYLEKSFKTL